VCVADEMPPPVIDATSWCAISLYSVSRAASLPELRWLLLSGRRRHAVPASRAGALAMSSIGEQGCVHGVVRGAGVASRAIVASVAWRCGAAVCCRVVCRVSSSRAVDAPLLLLCMCV
jgi:hypothetical protein